MHINPLTVEKIAKLHDGYIEIGTRLILLENIVEHLPRRREPREPVREPRSDKASIIAAKAAKTAQLAAELRPSSPVKGVMA